MARKKSSCVIILGKRTLFLKRVPLRKGLYNAFYSVPTAYLYFLWREKVGGFLKLFFSYSASGCQRKIGLRAAFTSSIRRRGV